MNNKLKTFNGLGISSKWGICGLPLRFDSYQTCGFGCKYCFANCRKYMTHSKEFKAAKLSQLRFLLTHETRCERYKLLQALLLKGITVHCGSLADPFQPIEKELGITAKAVDIFNEHGVHVLFSTKSDTVYDTDIRPDLHTFQLSVTNVNDDKLIEPNVPPIERRLRFFKELKADGFKVGIRLQPFIPNVTTLDVVKTFRDADHFTIEGLKLPIGNDETTEELLEHYGLRKKDFENNASLWKMKADRRLELYQPFLEYFKENDISYSVADNDLRYIGNNFCCCGDSLAYKSSGFDTTCMLMRHGRDYQLEDVLSAIDCLGIGDLPADYYAPQKDAFGSKTVKDFITRRFNAKRSNVSPKYQYIQDEQE